MCDPSSLFKVQGALSILEGVGGYIGARDQAQNQERYQEAIARMNRENAKHANDAYEENLKQLQRRSLEERDATLQKLEASQKVSLEALGTAKAHQGAQGVGGLSIQGIRRHMKGQKEASVHSILQNYKGRARQQKAQRRSLYIQALNQTQNQTPLQSVVRPSFLPYGLRIGSGLLNAYTRRKG